MSDLIAELLARKVADSQDRDAWLEARNNGVTASDAGSLAKESSLDTVFKGKFYTDFTGNAATNWGLEREPFMLEWAGFPQNTLLFHSAEERRFMATPDGFRMSEDGSSLVLAQVKTSSKPLAEKTPIGYFRQIQWEMFVTGATENWLIWEHHENFVPVNIEPEVRIIKRDEDVINQIKTLAYLLLEKLDAGKSFEREMGI